MFVKLLNGDVIDLDVSGTGEDLYRAVHAALPFEDRPPLWRMMLMRSADWIRPDGEFVELQEHEVLSLWVEPYDYQWSYDVVDEVTDADNDRMKYAVVDLRVRCADEVVYETRLYFRADWRGSGFFQDDEVVYDPESHTILIHRMDWFHSGWEEVVEGADLSLCVKELLSMEMRYDPVLSRWMGPERTALGLCMMYMGDAADML
jgi:hypothetical protein